MKIKLLRFSLTLISNRKWNSMFFGELAVDGEGEREREGVCVCEGERERERERGS